MGVLKNFSRLSVGAGFAHEFKPVFAAGGRSYTSIVPGGDDGDLVQVQNFSRWSK
jgi:hypothetical protein